MTSERKNKIYAVNKHHQFNHRYGEFPYSEHLEQCHAVAIQYIHLIPIDDRENVLSAIWMHDLIEDCGLTYNNIKNITGSSMIADIVYSVSDEKGKTRKERHSSKYYTGIIKTKYALFVKLCDRIANVSNSSKFEKQKFEMYKKEHLEFVSNLISLDYIEMFQYLQSLF